MIPTAGREILADILGNANQAMPLYVAYGTGTTAAAAGDTTLGSESGRIEATVERMSVLSPLDTLRFSGSETCDATETISEVGVLTASSGGTLIGRLILSPTVAVTSGNTVVPVYWITVKDGGNNGGSGW